MTDQIAHNGFALPPIGLGTYKLNGVPGATAVSAAVKSGYRLIDSAYNYENEGAVGYGVQDSGIARDSLIVTGKLPGRYHEYDSALRAIEESVFRLGLGRVDLMLVHWPNPITDRYVEAWTALIEAQQQGLVGQIGVSNFLPAHIERLETETGVLPVVNQIELHPYFPQRAQVEYHRSKGIITQAWSPVGRGNDIAEHPVVTAIANEVGVSPIQTILAWHVARGVVALPKSQDPGRQRENLEAAAVSLSAEQVERITALERVDGRLKGQDPAVYEEF